METIKQTKLDEREALMGFAGPEFLQVKIKKLNPDAVIPTYAKPGDAGMDLTAVDIHYDENNNVVYKTGLAFEIPEGYVGLIFPRSSNRKTDMYLTNSVGVIDSGYRGEVAVSFKHRDSYSSRDTEYKRGDRVAQMIIMPYPTIEFVEVDELSNTERGEGGHGSTGR